jgi:general secretion pathway protein K
MDELRHIPGITDEIYKKLLPHVTIFGVGEHTVPAPVNINSADKYVLMSLSDDISEDMAARIIAYRELKPFVAVSDLKKVAGFTGNLGTQLDATKISVKGTAFSVTVTAIQEDLKRTITAVIDNSTEKFVYKYWKET